MSHDITHKAVIPAGSAQAAPKINQARIVADNAEFWLAVLGVVACVFQVALAALGFWGANAAGGTESATRAAFEPHGVLGQVLQYGAILTLIAGIVSRANKKTWILPAVLVILLWVVQGLLVGLGFEVNILFGGLHALDGMVITALFLWLAYDRRRHPLGR